MPHRRCFVNVWISREAGIDSKGEERRLGLQSKQAAIRKHSKKEIN
jgi:hypothetical protein